MQEMEIKENPLNLKVYVNGIPDLRLIPEEKAEILFSALELEISKLFEQGKAKTISIQAEDNKKILFFDNSVVGQGEREVI